MLLKSLLDNRYTAPVLVTIILFGGHLSYGILESYERTAIAILTCVAAEIVLSKIFHKKWPHLASAYISGISVAMLLRSPAFWPYAVASLLTITSKYVLRVDNRHIWNPSNFGITIMLLIAPYHVAHLSVQWGNDLWAMLVIWTLGTIIIYRLKRFHICAAYVASFLAFAAVRAYIGGDPLLSEVAPITGPMYQLFVFFMITDPRTTVRSKRAQVAVVVIVAALEAVLRGFELVHAPFYALFVVGPIALVIEKWVEKRRLKAPRPATVSATDPLAVGV